MPRVREPESLLVLRFMGGDLDKNSLPIYELGLVLIAMQRLFHKAYLAENERLEKQAFPTKKERRELALQIGAHEKRSDIYALIPFLSDPTVIATLKSSVEFVMLGLARYALKDLIQRLRGEKNQKKQIYIGSIHAEVVNVIDRIDGLSGCDSIEIGCSRQLARSEAATLVLDRSTRAYAHAVENEYFLGGIQQIEGVVYKFYPNIFMVEIRRRPGGKKCKLFMSEGDFERVRYDKVRTPYLVVSGRPRYRIGTERRSYDEFQVNRIERVDDPDEM